MTYRRTDQQAEIIPPTYRDPHPQPGQQNIIIYQPKPPPRRPNTCLIITATALLTALCICGTIIALPLIHPEPLFTDTAPQNRADPARPAHQATQKPPNQTRDGLIITRASIAQFTPSGFYRPDPGNWWQLDVQFHNPTNRPLDIKTADIIMRDLSGNEYWWDMGVTTFGADGDLIKRINPNATTTLPVVFDMPPQATTLTAHYDGGRLVVAKEE